MRAVTGSGLCKLTTTGFGDGFFCANRRKIKKDEKIEKKP